MAWVSRAHTKEIDRAYLQCFGLNSSSLLPSLPLSIPISVSLLSSSLFSIQSLLYYELLSISFWAEWKCCLYTFHTQDDIMQQSYIRGSQGPKGLITGIRDVSSKNWVTREVCVCMWKAGTLHVNSWAGVCFCHILVLLAGYKIVFNRFNEHEVYVSIFLPTMFYSYINVYIGKTEAWHQAGGMTQLN